MGIAPDQVKQLKVALKNYEKKRSERNRSNPTLQEA